MLLTANRAQTMFHYEKVFRESLTANRLIEVHCERCGCDYYYELARIGMGTASAPYGLGQQRAQRAAKEKAQRDIETRLAREAELVPCPKCSWISHALIVGYRRSQHRGVLSLGRSSALIGLIALGIGAIAYCVPSHNSETFFALVVMFVVAPGLVISGLAFLLRTYLQRRIQPNHNYPEPPAVPAGTPRALLRDARSGDLEAAGTARLDTGSQHDSVELQIGRCCIPPFCCECLARADETCAYNAQVSNAVCLAIPFCHVCARRWKRKQLSSGLLAAAPWAALLAFGAIWLATSLGLDPHLVFSLTLVTVLVPLVVGMRVGRSIMPVRVQTIDASRGAIRIFVQNPRYREMLVKANSDDVAEIST
jgi:hypothetical protein